MPVKLKLENPLYHSIDFGTVKARNVAGQAGKLLIINPTADGLDYSSQPLSALLDRLDRLRVTQIKDGFNLMNLQNLPLLQSGYVWRDEFRDSTGIDAGLSSDYVHRGTPNFDVVRPAGDVLDENYTTGDDAQYNNEPLDSYTKLLLHMDGTDGSTTFTDETGKVVTAVGGAQIDTAQSKFGGASGLFDGAGDYLELADHDDWDFTGSDGTIDFWLRVNAMPASGVAQLIGQANAGSQDWFIYLYTDGTLAIGQSGVSQLATAAGEITTAAWYHVAATRTNSTSTTKIYINGVEKASGTGAYWTSSTGFLRIGGGSGQPYDFNGWIEELRISKGIVRWTAGFTPPTQAYGPLDVAQSFTPTTTKLYVTVELLLLASGSPDGNVVLEVQTNDAGKPSGTVVASISVAASTIGTSQTYVVFDVPDTALGVLHWLVLKRTGATVGAISWRYDSTSPAYAGGNVAVSSNGGATWGIESGQDTLFKSYVLDASFSAVVISTAWASPVSNPGEILVSWGETPGAGSISVFVSRDNGATWTEATTPTVVPGDPDYAFKWKNVDVSAQPAGSNLRVKTVINSNAQLEAISMGV